MRKQASNDSGQSIEPCGTEHMTYAIKDLQSQYCKMNLLEVSLTGETV